MERTKQCYWTHFIVQAKSWTRLIFTLKSQQFECTHKLNDMMIWLLLLEQFCSLKMVLAKWENNLQQWAAHTHTTGSSYCRGCTSDMKSCACFSAFVVWYQILYALFTGMSMPLYKTTNVQETCTMKWQGMKGRGGGDDDDWGPATVDKSVKWQHTVHQSKSSFKSTLYRITKFLHHRHAFCWICRRKVHMLKR